VPGRGGVNKALHEGLKVIGRRVDALALRARYADASHRNSEAIIDGVERAAADLRELVRGKTNG
jgi:hypothetical protein